MDKYEAYAYRLIREEMLKARSGLGYGSFYNNEAWAIRKTLEHFFPDPRPYWLI